MIRIEIDKDFPKKMDKVIEAGQKALDNEVLTRNSKYIPFGDGTLDRMGKMATKIGSGEIIYPGPYARFLYYGKVMIGEKSHSPWAKKGERKVLTDRDLTFSGAPIRGSKWFERMKNAETKAIMKAVAKAAEKAMK